MIEIRQLRKLYDHTLAVDGIDVAIPNGVVCGLVGPNGAGKTTTLRCLAGLLRPTSGEIRIAGLDPVVDAISVKRIVAYVPDDPPLFDDLTVGKQIDFVARVYRIANHRETAMSWLRKFDLENKVDASVASLSRGMRQKLAVIAALTMQPQVLLLDEPLTGLDPPGIRQLLHMMVEFAREGGTVVVSSHLLAVIADICDQVWMMQSGHVRYHGTINELRTRFPNARSLEDAFFAATST